jgi:hypothetical protein
MRAPATATRRHRPWVLRNTAGDGDARADLFTHVTCQPRAVGGKHARRCAVSVRTV